MDNIRSNPVLLFFLDAAVFFFTGCSLYGTPAPDPAARRIVVRFKPTAVENFIDLLTLANISVIFFDSPFHGSQPPHPGYYLHGMNPAGKSDTNLKDLISSIEEYESKPGRGLSVDDGSNLQTFEIFIPVDFRVQYNKVAAR